MPLSVSLVTAADSGYTSSGVTSKSATRTASVQVGDLLVAWITGSVDKSVTSVTDGKFGTLIVDQTNAHAVDSADANWCCMAAQVATSAYSSGSITSTVNFSTSNAYAEILVAQFRPSAGYIFQPSPQCAGVGAYVAAPGTGAGAITSGNTTVTISGSRVGALEVSVGQDVTGSNPVTNAAGWAQAFSGGSFALMNYNLITSTSSTEHGSYTANASDGAAHFTCVFAAFGIQSASVGPPPVASMQTYAMR